MDKGVQHDPTHSSLGYRRPVSEAIMPRLQLVAIPRQ